MSEYIKHILEQVENKELTAKNAYEILNPIGSKTIKNGITLGNKHKCWYCGESGDINKDHFYPKSKGGNLKVYSCISCNREKAAKTPAQWISYIQNKMNNGTITKDKGNRMITATISLWNELERKSY